MSSQARLVAYQLALTCVIVAGNVGFSRSLVLRSADSARATTAALALQSNQLARQNERLGALEASCRKSSGDGRAPGAAVLSPEEIDRLSAVVAERVAVANAPAPPVPPSPESIAAFDAGRRVIGAALETKRWTEADAQKLRALLPTLTLDDRVELQRQISVAINERQIKLDFRGPLF